MSLNSHEIIILTYHYNGTARYPIRTTVNPNSSTPHLNMKHFQLVTSLKILLTATKIYPIAPIIITSQTDIQTSKNLKLLYISISFPTAIYLLYHHIFSQENSELRNDPYLVIGYIRALFSSACPFLTSAVILMKCEHLTTSFRILMNLQTTLQLNARKLNLIFSIITLQLILLYLANGVWCFLLYSPKIKNFYLRLAISISNSVLNVSMIACEFIYLNGILLITEYVNMMNNQLEHEMGQWENIIPLAW